MIMKWFVWVYRHIYLQPDIEVVGEAENGRKGSELALQLRPDIILMDLVMDEMDGVEATRAIIKNGQKQNCSCNKLFR